ncbi:SGNH hydrolase [Delitschia confertaspora ATCC 74209]|uniref:SGNH hydrolase n=1 Tax=Delitschia confertaspora ATCC 74209 TaxID=1513339 RepID=A0A9P4N2D7_9PLEO|nr:SGNH hydrolase [Delitschia confertaspora ATCC 74209]
MVLNLGAILALGLLGLAQAAPTATPPTVKIMPFGASIVGAPGCWRANLWKKLQDAKVTNIDFVGSNKAPDCGANFKGYDGENEGHAGALATDYAKNKNLTGWLKDAKPDIVLMHVGTNDIIQGRKTEEILDAYSKLVDEMRGSTKNMKILISTLIPISPDKFPDRDVPSGIKDLNSHMFDWAKKKSTKESPILIVDNYKGFDVAKDTRDGEHTNASGDEKMATKFYDGLVDVIKGVSATMVLEYAWEMMTQVFSLMR